MKKSGLAQSLRALITYDAVDDEVVELAKSVGVDVHKYADVILAGVGSDEEFRKAKFDDFPIFSYTSGTTGDSKGVKLTHKNLLSSCQAIMTSFDFNSEDVMISYLPYPHSFEQVMTTVTCISGSKIGYYSGDPVRLTEDCQVL